MNELINYLEIKALTREANAWDLSYANLIKIFNNYPDHPEVKKAISLLCKFYVRKHLANHEIRNLFVKMDRKYVASEIKKFISSEKQWLEKTLKNEPDTFKSHCFNEEYSRASLKELYQLADDLEKGHNIDHGKYDQWAESLKFRALINKRNEYIKPKANKKR